MLDSLANRVLQVLLRIYIVVFKDVLYVGLCWIEFVTFEGRHWWFDTKSFALGDPFYVGAFLKFQTQLFWQKIAQCVVFYFIVCVNLEMVSHARTGGTVLSDAHWISWFHAVLTFKTWDMQQFTPSILEYEFKIGNRAVKIQLLAEILYEGIMYNIFKEKQEIPCQWWEH